MVHRPGRGARRLPGIAASQDKLLALVPCTVIEHADGPHAFDMVDDSPRTHEVIDEVLAWLRSRGA